ncbi:MAG: hypothetical protein QM708_04540 [Propioniciclava sp.]|uniref:hypothetical protein n=1 Tax=Propioniciclava sp. TaxID=2038686 RepID=UPI0039E644AA
MKKRHGRADFRRRRGIAAVVSLVLAVLGLSLVTVGVIAWSSPRQDPALLSREVWVPVRPTPWFDPGTTIFAVTRPTAMPTAEQLNCSLRTPDGVVTPLARLADADRLGSRVKSGVSLSPVLDVGRTGAGTELACAGLALDDGEVWLLPTLPFMSTTPLSVVIAGVGCFGLALLINPRARGQHRA